MKSTSALLLRIQLKDQSVLPLLGYAERGHSRLMFYSKDILAQSPLVFLEEDFSHVPARKIDNKKGMTSIIPSRGTAKHLQQIMTEAMPDLGMSARG